MFDPVAFGKKLKHKRLVKGITQQEVYARVGVATLTLYRIEKAKSSCTLETLALVATAMDCDLVVELVDRHG